MTGSAILLIDDQGLVRHGLQLLMLDLMPSLLIRSAGSLREGLTLLDAGGRFDLVFLDLTLEDVHGLSGLIRLRDTYPYVPVVVCSAQDDRDTVMASLERGAMGFISKSASPEELRTALRDVLQERRIHLPQSVSVRAVQGHTTRALGDLSALGLTERQIEVLGLVVQGLRNKEIARVLRISEVMVKKHITPALQALAAPDRTKLLVRLHEMGYSMSAHDASATMVTPT